MHDISKEYWQYHVNEDFCSVFLLLHFGRNISEFLKMRGLVQYAGYITFQLNENTFHLDIYTWFNFFIQVPTLDKFTVPLHTRLNV